MSSPDQSAARTEGIQFGAKNELVSIEFLHEAIRNLPEKERSSFEKAQEICPSLIQKESDPLLYLEFDQYNPWVSAKRLTTYWRLREEAFGKRAFRTLDLSEQGVFTQDEITVIKEGIVSWTLLPPTSRGESVLYFDRESRDAGNRVALAGRKKFMFFHWASIGLQKTAQQNGCVLLVKLCLRTADSSKAGFRLALAIIDSLPVKLNRMCIALPPGHKSRRLLLETVVPLSEGRMCSVFGNLPYEVYCDSTQEELLASLTTKEGFTNEGLPEGLGGSFSLGGNVSSPKIVIEATLVQRALADYMAINSPPPAQDLNVKPRASHNRSSFSQITEAVRRRREKDLIYSRKKRQREKENQQRLLMESVRLDNENDRLKREEARLLSLLEQARFFLNQHHQFLISAPVVAPGPSTAALFFPPNTRNMFPPVILDGSEKTEQHYESE